jgi:2-polyprenyl-6-methoxyphenol hydroxylase-like FAD-dependent oxidoreductase
MRYTDIAVIGGGLAGSTAAAMLGRAGIATVLIDPHAVYPPDFRIEKLSGEAQIARLGDTGLAESVLRRATREDKTWIARFGYLLDRAPRPQFGIMYDTLVNTIRGEIPASVERIVAKAIAVKTSEDRQKITLSTNEAISARLVVLANGLNIGLRQTLGIERHIVSPCHCIAVGFDIAPVGRRAFDFPALTYFSERPGDRIAYLSLFAVGGRMRGNLFVYRAFNDPWLRELRLVPVRTLHETLPRLRRLTGEFSILGPLQVRPADLYVNASYRRPGVVMVGDAFMSTCPVTGTGADKAFTDVARLCHVHIPAWLSSDGMAEDKIAAFYDDPVKQACDAWSVAKAHDFRRVTIDGGWQWRAQRWARFLGWLGRGLVRRLCNGPFSARRAQASSSFSSISSSSSSSSSLSSSA